MIKHLILQKNTKYDKYEHRLASMVYMSFDKKKLEIKKTVKIAPNKEFTKELQKPSNNKFEKRKVHTSFIDNIWGTDLADMQLLSHLIKELGFYCVLLIFLVNMLGLFL